MEGETAKVRRDARLPRYKDLKPLSVDQSSISPELYSNPGQTPPASFSPDPKFSRPRPRRCAVVPVAGSCGQKTDCHPNRPAARHGAADGLVDIFGCRLVACRIICRPVQVKPWPVRQGTTADGAWTTSFHYLGTSSAHFANHLRGWWHLWRTYLINI